MNLLSNPLILILLVVGALIPIFNGKTLLQIVLDLLIPKPPAASAQAWQYYTRLAQEALARGDAAAAEDLAARAAKEAAQYREQEMEFNPAGILQWIMNLVTGGAGGGMLPLLLIGGVIFLTMGGCPQMPPNLSLPSPDAEVQASDLQTAAEPTSMFVSLTSPWGPREPEPAPLDPEPLLPTPAPEVEPVSVVVPAIVAQPTTVHGRTAHGMCLLRSRGPLRSWIASRPLLRLMQARPLRRLLCWRR